MYKRFSWNDVFFGEYADFFSKIHVMPWGGEESTQRYIKETVGGTNFKETWNNSYSHWVCSKHDFSSRKSTAELKSWPCSQPSIVRNLDYIRKRSISNQHCTKNSFWYDICVFWMQVWLNGTYRHFILTDINLWALGFE